MAAEDNKRPVTVAVDAMGGDYAPGEIVRGAIDVASASDMHVLLVGDQGAVEKELSKYSVSGLPVMAVPSEGVIMEGESPTQALRQKPRASIIVATGLVKHQKADAVVTMGSTGAAMAAAALTFGVMKGIERPALGGPILGIAPNTVVVDLGTSVDCRPSQLVSFGVIGAVFAHHILSVENPRVGLLSVGAEEGKGNRQVKEATELLRRSHLNFVGNVEATELPLGKADVVVCDGFVGNIVMKLSECLGESIGRFVAEELEGKLPSSDIAKLSRKIFDLTNLVENVGGGPIFGVRGVSVVGHGRSKAGAVSRAIRTAKLAIELDFTNTLESELKKVEEFISQ